MKHFRLLAVCLPSLFLFAGPKLAAQTVSPVIVEFREKAAGRFQIHNDADVPLTVVLEPRSFRVDSDGKPTFGPLDPEIHLDLSSMSFRVEPQQDYYVFYKASAEALPAWFCIYANITGPHTQQGIQVRLELPHTVYLLGKKPLDPADLAWIQALTSEDKQGKKIEAEIENRSGEVSRVREVEVTSTQGKQTYDGFPLFPGQQRKIELEWNQPGEPKHIELKFDRFKVDADLHERSE